MSALWALQLMGKEFKKKKKKSGGGWDGAKIAKQHKKKKPHENTRRRTCGCFSVKRAETSGLRKMNVPQGVSNVMSQGNSNKLPLIRLKVDGQSHTETVKCPFFFFFSFLNAKILRLPDGCSSPLQVSIGCPEKMEPITKVSHIPASRWALSCSLCREHTGTCIQVRRTNAACRGSANSDEGCVRSSPGSRSPLPQKCTHPPHRHFVTPYEGRTADVFIYVDDKLSDRHTCNSVVRMCAGCI